MILITAPSGINSAHRPIEFVYDFDSKEVDYVLNNGGGFAKFTCGLFTVPPIVGGLIYITGGIYKGLHKVTAIAGTDIVVDAAYIGNQTDFRLKSIVVPEIKVYKGYDTGEEYPTELPLTLIATFTPIYNVDFEISFDISGFIKSIFTIVPPVAGIDFSLFNRFRLYFEGAYHEVYTAVNSSIPTGELNAIYAGTGVYLGAPDSQIIFSCGNTALSLMESTGVVTNIIIEDGIEGCDYDYNDYQYFDYGTCYSPGT